MFHYFYLNELVYEFLTYYIVYFLNVFAMVVYSLSLLMILLPSMMMIYSSHQHLMWTIKTIPIGISRNPNYLTILVDPSPIHRSLPNTIKVTNTSSISINLGSLRRFSSFKRSYSLTPYSPVYSSSSLLAFLYIFYSHRSLFNRFFLVTFSSLLSFLWWQ